MIEDTSSSSTSCTLAASSQHLPDLTLQNPSAPQFSVLRYESVIHEFDPYFNYRSTIKLVSGNTRQQRLTVFAAAGVANSAQEINSRQCIMGSWHVLKTSKSTGLRFSRAANRQEAPHSA